MRPQESSSLYRDLEDFAYKKLKEAFSTDESFYAIRSQVVPGEATAEVQSSLVSAVFYYALNHAHEHEDEDETE